MQKYLRTIMSSVISIKHEYDFTQLEMVLQLIL